MINWILTFLKLFKMGWLRYPMMIVSLIGQVLGIAYLIRLKRETRRLKIRKATLTTLRDILLEHTGERIIVKIVPAQKRKVLGDVNAHYVTIPCPVDGWCSIGSQKLYFYAREYFPAGYYRYTARPDCLIFELYEVDGNSLTNFCIALQIDAPKNGDDYFEQICPL